MRRRSESCSQLRRAKLEMLDAPSTTHLDRLARLKELLRQDASDGTSLLIYDHFLSHARRGCRCRVMR